MSANKDKKGADMMELDDRKLRILKAVIQNYLETGEPVGSRTISKYTDLKLSSATIEMRWQTLKNSDILYNLIHRQDVFLQIRDTDYMLMI